MLDVSDGLLRDAGRIGAASGVRLDLSRRLLAPAVEELIETAEMIGADPWTWVLTGGEDHGLLATFPAHAVLPAEFRRIGVVVDDANDDDGAGPTAHVTIDGAAWSGVSGWDHFDGS